ncbi:translation initiation factor IF-2 N-terminal domain-containing protein [Propionimicrobium sp. PCR01-08-3]|uniref:translation initiation factor IF-2 N-terminal domain-containing protein n=1 Tax=Propionimicrobium sp. PCR01-08-3 TaxID=3052086 RepID=UPI00255C9924|nr:translation initiation factor IF-2 N-terminal domain-containing protein [Propionimicrobium sp. PCR01-08-3]WIY82308.1 translation initiation factor IF-2 N-terminal domain-containing protein [Propionimicrobium sp. PCR01-08-3]
MTTKARVYELARELGISSRELLATLTEMGGSSARRLRHWRLRLFGECARSSAHR